MEKTLDNFDTEKFIDEIKCRPPIWDSACEGYANRDLKKKCWDEVVHMFGGGGASATQRRYLEITLQRKWKGIRGCFTRELRRQGNVKAGMDPGARKTEYTYFQQMLFLRNYVTSKSTLPSNTECLFEDEESSAVPMIKHEDSNDGNCSSKHQDDYDEGSSKLEDTSDDFSKLEEVNVEFDSADPLREIKRLKLKKPKYYSMTEDDDLLFLLSMLKTLHRVPAKTKMVTRMKLLAVLDEAIKDLEN